ncbi:MAG: hypothetical protein R3E39_14245 [Anaerolineae bacterium]
MNALQIAPQLRATKSTSNLNFQHFVTEIAWFGLAFPAMDRFREVFAIRLGMDASQLIWMASLPALILLVTSSLAEHWLRRYNEPLQAIFWPGIGFRLAFLLPALTSFMPAQLQIPWLFLAVGLPAAAQGIAAVGFIVMLREAVPEKEIARLHSRRLLALNLTVSVSGLAIGLWLDKVPFPINYQIMFAAAFIFSMVSWVYVNKVRALPEIVTPTPGFNCVACQSVQVPTLPGSRCRHRFKFHFFYRHQNRLFRCTSFETLGSMNGTSAISDLRI